MPFLSSKNKLIKLPYYRLQQFATHLVGAVTLVNLSEVYKGAGEFQGLEHTNATSIRIEL